VGVTVIFSNFESGLCWAKHHCTSYSVIVWVKVVLKRTVVGHWRFDNLSGSHLQSQVNSVCQMMMMMLTLKMTSAQVVETSVTNNSSFQNYLHPDDHTIQITDISWVQTIYSIIVLLSKNFPSIQVASLRKQKTVEAREEESEEIKHIKKVINLLSCTQMCSKMQCPLNKNKFMNF